MDEYEKIDNKLILKQENCNHSCWRCHLCGLHKDNYKTAEQEYIKKLENRLAEYELNLTSLGFSFIPFEVCSCNGIVIKIEHRIVL